MHQLPAEQESAVRAFRRLLFVPLAR